MKITLREYPEEHFSNDAVDGYLLDGPHPAKIVAVCDRKDPLPAPGAIRLVIQTPVAKKLKRNYTRVLQKQIWASPKDQVEVRFHQLNRLPVVHS